MEKETPSPEKPKTVSFDHFLASYPPNTQALLDDPIIEGSSFGHVTFHIDTPDIQINCDHSSCDGIRFFKPDQDSSRIKENEWEHHFLTYTCKNCEERVKYYTLFLYKSEGKVEVIKIGEWPPFGPKTPTRLLRILGDDKDLFLYGRRCEFQGLGIGAFAYYRRVVENKKDLLFDEIIRVVKKVKNSSGIIKQLEKAKGEFKFNRSVEDIKAAIPEILLIDGHNPLNLLHRALSSGIHGKSDNECLELAQDIRRILVEFIERLEQALAGRKELNDAVSRLLVKTKKAKTESEEQT